MRHLQIALLVVALFFTTPALAADGDGGPDDPGAGHRAGYRWAELHDIYDPDDCHACLNCTSFRAGCRTYAEKRRTEVERENKATEQEGRGDW